MRILHTSDWHLGRLFHQFSLIDEQRYAITQVLEAIKVHQPDVILIAGDIYDRSVPPASAIQLFNDFVDTCLGELGVPIIAISGNHDGAERLGFAANQLAKANIHLVTSLAQMQQPITLTDDAGEVDFWAVPFHDPAQVAAFYGAPEQDYNSAHKTIIDNLNITPNRRSVLISHCYLDGATDSESERPLSIGGADRVDWQLFKPFSYAALGHLHQPQYKGKQHIRYSGSLLKYSFSEQHHNKSMTLVDIDADGQCHIELIAIQHRRDLRVIQGHFDDIIEGAKNDTHTDDFIQVVLTDSQAILNPMARLREYYPNILELKKQRFHVQPGSQLARASEQLKRTDLDIFEDFFEQVHDQKLNTEQRQQLQQVIQRLEQQEQDQ